MARIRRPFPLSPQLSLSFSLSSALVVVFVWGRGALFARSRQVPCARVRVVLSMGKRWLRARTNAWQRREEREGGGRERAEPKGVFRVKTNRCV